MDTTGMPKAADPDLNDPAQWAQVVETYYDRVFRTALNQTRQQALAEEVAQETFVRAFEKRDQFDGRGALGSWLYRIAVNLSRDVVRRENLRSHVGLALAAERPSQTLHPPEATHRKDLLEVLQRALDSVPEPLRRAFEQTVVLGYTYREAAEIEGVPEGTIASRVARTRTMLVRKCQNLPL